MDRTSHVALQLVNCARALGIESRAGVSQLQCLLEDKGVLHDAAHLQRIAREGSLLRRLCYMAEIGVFRLLSLLPGDTGSQEWATVLNQQFKIESEVQFWREAFCKQYRLGCASMAQVCSGTTASIPYVITAVAVPHAVMMPPTDWQVLMQHPCLSSRHVTGTCILACKAYVVIPACLLKLKHCNCLVAVTDTSVASNTLWF